MKTLLKVHGATGYLLVIFLNTFVDLGHKITIQNTLFTVYSGSTQVILTAIVNALILLPFVLLFIPAGYIGDRFPKHRVLRKSALVAVLLTLAITLSYYQGWFWSAFILTLLLAVQSAIYSPAKYGYVKALFGAEGLAAANGIVQAVTILAILSATFIFSLLFQAWLPEGVTDSTAIIKAVAPIGWLLVLNSVIELYLAYRLPACDSGSNETWAEASRRNRGGLLKQGLGPVLANTTIRLSVLGLAMFWSIGQVMLAAFPAFAKESLGITEPAVIQTVLAASGLGIALGSFVAAKRCQKRIDTGLIPLAAVGISIGLVLLTQCQSVQSCFVVFLWIGVMGGMFIVPLNALIQLQAKEGELAKVIAGNNLLQNIAMLAFLLLTVVVSLAGFGSYTLLVIIAAVSVFASLYAVYTLPKSLIRTVFAAMLSRCYRLDVKGLNHMPEQGGVLLLGNHISFIDWAIVQLATPRPVRFVMLKSIYQRWYLQWFFKLNGCIPIEPGPSSEQTLKEIGALLNQGEVVCLFPEGKISKTGQLDVFRRGYESACKIANDSLVVVPFYIQGLWGSKFSKSANKSKSPGSRWCYRKLHVAFGQPLDKNVSAERVKQQVARLSGCRLDRGRCVQ